MISVAPIGGGLVAYLMRMAHERYYFDGGEPPGTWCGSACRRLGLWGEVVREQLRGLTEGFAPNGDKLVQNAGKFQGDRKRQLGVSYVFNASKSWSVLWAFAEPQLQQQLQAAFDRAVKRCIREYIEPEIARCRLRGGTEIPAKLIAAVFTHVTSRKNDMHYHAHVLFPNIGLCPDGRTRALVSQHFYDHKLDAGAYFRLALECECQKLGLQFYRPLDPKGAKKDYVEVKGVPAKICRHFSKRREQIEDKLAARGLQSAAASSLATLQTRGGKETVASRPQLFAAWRAEAQQNGLSLEWLKGALSQRREIDNQKKYGRALRDGVENCTQREGHFQRKDIFRETFVSAQGGGGADPLKLYAQLNHDLEKSPAFVNLGVRGNVQRYTVPEVLRVEKQMLGDVERLHAAPFKRIGDRIVQKAADKERPINPCRATTLAGKLVDALVGDKTAFALDDEQKACVRYATQSPGCVKVIHGPAGTAKTSVLAAVADAYRRAGWKTYGAAVAGVAAKNLEEKTRIQSDTVQMTLLRLYPTSAGLAKHHVRQLWRAAQGLPTYKPDRLRLDRKSVLFVDEASMVGTRDFALLAKACAKSRATLVLAGDHRQLPAIEQGGAFGSIVNKVPSFQLTSIKRQESDEHRKRVQQLSRGEAEAVIKAYAKDGGLHVARTHRDAQKKLIEDWANSGGAEAPKDHVVFAATNMEVRALNDLAQQKRLALKQIGAFRSVTVGDETFYPGDRVLFTKKSRKLGVENGDCGTIVGIRNNPLSAAVKVRLDGEKTTHDIPLRTVLLTDYDGLTRGYAMTVHKMQGRSVEHAYCHLAGCMTDRELTYVAFSRHRKTLQIYTDENHAGVELTNLARQANCGGPRIEPKPGLTEEYSPLIKEASKSRAKTLAADHQRDHGLTLKIEPQGGAP